MGTVTLQLDRVLFNELSRYLDDRHIASQPTVIEPIGPERWNVIGVAGVVHGNDDEVGAIVQQRSCLAVEGRETSFVFAQRLLVQPDMSAVICGAEIDKGTSVRLWVVVKGFLVPDGAL